MCCKETDSAVVMLEALFIGYGNSLRADDGAGLAVIEKLTALLPTYCNQCVRLISCAQLTPELATDIAQAHRVIFVDATMALPPGHMSISPAHPEESNMLMGHHFTPGALLAITQHALGACPGAWVAAIGCQSIEISDQLTPTVATAVDHLSRHLLKCLARWAREPGFLPKLLVDSDSASMINDGN